MRKSTSILVAVIAIGLATCSKDQSAEVSNLFKPSKQRYIVFVKPGTIAPFVSDASFYQNAKDVQANERIAKKKEVKKIIDAHHLQVNDSEIFVDVVVAFVTMIDSVKADSVRQHDPRIQSISLDVDIEGKPIQQGTPIPEGKPIQQVGSEDHEQEWGLKKFGQCWTSCAVKQAKGGVDGSALPAVIWIVDTGIAAGPPSTGNPFLNIKTDWGVNFTVTPHTKDANDDNGHGTMVAGVAAAKKINWDATNRICAGVSAGAWLVPMKVLDARGSGRWSWIIDALDHIIKQGRRGDVINLSLGDYPISNCSTEIPELAMTLTNAASQHFIVMASGNDQSDAAKSVPGCLDGENLFTVASVSCKKQCVLFSNYGDPVDWVAVGTDIFTTYLFNTTTQKWEFVVSSGTSLSAAVISGVVHLRGGAPQQGGATNCSVLGSTAPGRDYHLGKR